MFRLEIKKSANKFFKNLPKPVAKRISEAVLSLSKNANPELCGLQLSGINPKTFRIKVGVYRIIYRVDFERKFITVYKIAHRSNVYQGL